MYASLGYISITIGTIVRHKISLVRVRMGWGSGGGVLEHYCVGGGAVLYSRLVRVCVSVVWNFPACAIGGSVDYWVVVLLC